MGKAYYVSAKNVFTKNDDCHHIGVVITHAGGLQY